MTKSAEFREQARRAMEASQSAPDLETKRRFAAEALRLAQLGEQLALGESGILQTCGQGRLIEDHAIILANIERLKENIENASDPEIRYRARGLLAEAQAELTITDTPKRKR